MNRTLNSILLFAAGTGLSFMTGNILITTLGCFLLGLVLKKRDKQRSQEGARALGEMNMQQYRPEYVQAIFDNIRKEDETEYVVLVQKLRMSDESGRHWSIGVQTSKWYVYEQGNWVVDQPKGMMRLIDGDTTIFEKRKNTVAPTQTGTPHRDMYAMHEDETISEASLLASEETKYCINCGALIPTRAKYCPKCGGAQ